MEETCKKRERMEKAFINSIPFYRLYLYQYTKKYYNISISISEIEMYLEIVIPSWSLDSTCSLPHPIPIYPNDERNNGKKNENVGIFNRCKIHYSTLSIRCVSGHFGIYIHISCVVVIDLLSRSFSPSHFCSGY